MGRQARGGATLLGKTKAEPACARIAALEGTFAEMSSAWGMYRAHQPMLAEALVEQCTSAVAWRRDTSSAADTV